jgi:hypothetical protein
MFSRGARHFVFLSRSGARSEAAQKIVEYLLRRSCQVKDLICDITKEDAVRKAIETCKSSIPPIKGCIQGSMILQVSQSIDTLLTTKYSST